MEHFDAESWSDYVRGTAPDSQIALMRTHLEDGCETCAGHVAALEAVRRLVANERALGLEPGVVRSVRAMFRQRRVAVEAGRSPRLLQLVFDSRLAPAAGFRDGESEVRRLTFMSEELSLDLQLVERPAAEGGAQLLGEIVESDLGHLPEVPVALLAGDEVVAEAVTGELGQFELSTTAAQGLRLRFELEETFELEIPS